MKKLVLFFATTVLLLSSDFLNDAIKYGTPNSPMQQAAPSMDFDEALKSYKSNPDAGDAFLAMFMQGDFRGVAYLGEIFAKGYAGMDVDCKKAAYFLLAGITQNQCASYEMLFKLIDENTCFRRDNIQPYVQKYKECVR
jgi:hypothetical protein